MTQTDAPTINGIAHTTLTIEMPNGPRPGTYHLVLNFNNLCESERFASTNIMSAVGEGALGLSHLRAIFFQCARAQNGLRTLDEAGQMFQANPDAFDALNDGFTLAAVAMFPAKAGDDGNPT